MNLASADAPHVSSQTHQREAAEEGGPHVLTDDEIQALAMESQLDGLATVQVGLEVPSSTICIGLSIQVGLEVPSMYSGLSQVLVRESHGYDAGLLSACMGQ